MESVELEIHGDIKDGDIKARGAGDRDIWRHKGRGGYRTGGLYPRFLYKIKGN